MQSVMKERVYHSNKSLALEWGNTAKFAKADKPDEHDKKLWNNFEEWKGQLPLSDESEPVKNFIEGAIFMSTQPNKFNSDKKDFIFLKDGVEHILNGSGHAGYLMSKVPEGSKVNATYLGMKKQDKGTHVGVWSHQFDIQFAAPVVKEDAVAEDVAEDEIPF